MPQTYAGNRRLHLDLVRRTAAQAGLPPDVADAVAHLESRYSSGAVGIVGEIGLMQVRPQTAAMLGHLGGITELFQLETNVRYGVLYLTRAWQLAGGDLCRALMNYRAGWGEEQMTPLSAEYCRRARQHLAAIGSPLAGGMPVPGEQVHEALAGPIPAPPARPSLVGAPRPVTTAQAERRVPPPRPAKQAMAGAHMKVASAGPVRLAPPIPPVDTSKVKARRAIWAAHDVRMRAITSRISDVQLRISSGI